MKTLAVPANSEIGKVIGGKEKRSRETRTVNARALFDLLGNPKAYRGMISFLRQSYGVGPRGSLAEHVREGVDKLTKRATWFISRDAEKRVRARWQA